MTLSVRDGSKWEGVLHTYELEASASGVELLLATKKGALTDLAAKPETRRLFPLADIASLECKYSLHDDLLGARTHGARAAERARAPRPHTSAYGQLGTRARSAARPPPLPFPIGVRPLLRVQRCTRCARTARSRRARTARSASCRLRRRGLPRTASTAAVAAVAVRRCLSSARGALCASPGHAERLREEGGGAGELALHYARAISHHRARRASAARRLTPRRLTPRRARTDRRPLRRAYPRSDWDTARRKSEFAGWDQFTVNEQKFGVTSTYQEELYTTRLNRAAVSAEDEATAARLAAEIAGTAADHALLAEERGQHVAESATYDEEARYSTVLQGAQRDAHIRSAGGGGGGGAVSGVAQSRADGPTVESAGAPAGASAAAADASALAARSKLNPQAKAFVFNPQAKEFVPGGCGSTTMGGMGVMGGAMGMGVPGGRPLLPSMSGFACGCAYPAGAVRARRRRCAARPRGRAHDTAPRCAAPRPTDAAC